MLLGKCEPFYDPLVSRLLCKYHDGFQMIIWVRLHNLLLHLLHHKVLEVIGNTLGKFIKFNMDRDQKNIFTFVRICVEVVLSKVYLIKYFFFITMFNGPNY